jgi:hypothetical protein
MGVCLSTGNDGPHVICSWSGWLLLFNLAQEYGWEPRGTRLALWLRTDLTPEQEALARKEFADSARDWDGDYFTNDGQCVEGEDCQSMLRALDAARMDISNGIAREGSQAKRVAGSEGWRQLLDQMIVVCRIGYFYIW